MKIKLLLSSLIVLSWIVIPLAHANEGKEWKEGRFAHKGKEWREKKVEEMYAQLNLTEDQKKSLEENKKKNRGSKKEIFEKLRSNREALNSELMKPELDMNKVNEIQSQLKNLQSQMADERLSSILEVRKILTPEQFKKFNSLMGQHKDRRFSKDKE